MAHILRSAVLLLLAAAPLAASAQARIGLVDMQRAISEIDEGRVVQEQLKRDFDAKQKQVRAREQELQKLGEELNKRAAIDSEETKRQKAQEFQQKQREAQEYVIGLQKDFSEAERKATNAIYEKLAGLVAEIATREAFTVVLDRSPGNVVFAQPSLDITNEVVRAYNGRFPAKSAAKPAAPAAKPGAAAPAKPPAPAPATPANGTKK